MPAPPHPTKVFIDNKEIDLVCNITDKISWNGLSTVTIELLGTVSKSKNKTDGYRIDITTGEDVNTYPEREKDG